MLKENQSTVKPRLSWIRVLAVAILVVAYCIVSAFPSRREERRAAENADVKGIVTASLKSLLDSADTVISGLVSISEVGSGNKPLSIFLTRSEGDSGFEDYWFYADRAPVVPGGIMQTATLTYYLDQGAVSLEKRMPTRQGNLPELVQGTESPLPDAHVADYERMTGRDSIGVREGFLKSFRYVTDRYVFDDLEKGFRSEYRGFMDNLDLYFGTSDVFYVPPYYYRGPIKSSIASICGGSGIILSQGQILQFYGSIANGGVRPSYRYFPKKRICSEKVAREISALLRENVTEGTGVLLKDCPVLVSGKTGSGILDKGGVPGYGNINEKGAVRMCSFAGFFPSYAPKYTMCVTFYYNDYPGYSLPALAFGEIVKGLMDKQLL